MLILRFSFGDGVFRIGYGAFCVSSGSISMGEGLHKGLAGRGILGERLERR
jgi:hypothetical protein